MSNHEPECRAVNEDTPIRTNGCIFCGVARAAYQRGREDADRWCNVAEVAYRKGREDAARDVANTVGYTETWIDGTWDGNGGWRLSVPYDEAIAAARGDGEQECSHDFVQPIGDKTPHCEMCGTFQKEGDE